MRSRLLDVVLIAGLVVVAGGIMWTLFNLGSTARPTATPAPTQPAAAARPTGPTVTPVTPNTGAATASPIAVATPPTDESTTTTPPVTATGETPAATASVATPPTSAATTAAARVVPPGAVALERVGFSFATGGTGACGVVLEPWRHVAVSRDLLAAYGCGAEVVVTLDDPAGGRSEVAGVIGDTMNPSFELTVNVYVAADEPAFQYGLTTGTFTPR